MDTQTTKPFRVPFLIWVFFLMFLLIAGLAVFETVKAETFECLTSNTVINLTQKDCEVIACDSCCQTCPMTCDEGYSCQPDPIDPGEEQQYPPDAAAAWVASLGCIELTDVPLDDPRWGGREDGEVYAREGDGCLSLYWPVGGNALFDISSIVDNPAKWNDYLLSGDRPPGGGDYTVPDGKSAIQFNDGGTGGMTVFQSVDAPTDGFLANYTNPKREALPDNKIYPLGQKMHLSAWNPGSVNDVQMLHDNGFTTIGPFENSWPTANKNLKAMYQKAKDLGMRAWTFMHAGPDGVLVYKTCAAMKAGKTHAQIMQGMVDLWNNHYSKEPYNSISDAFVLLPEELASRLNTCDTSQLIAYDNAVIDKIKSLTGGTRPIIRTEVEGNGATNIVKADNRVGVGAQHYFERHGQPGSYTQAAITQVRARGYLAYMASLDRNYPIDYTRPRIVLPGMIYEPKDKSMAWSEKYANYYIWTNSIQGINGFSIYKMDRNVAGGNLKRAFIKTIKQFTSNGFDQAYLWGDRSPAMPVTFTRTSGPANADWTQGTMTYRAASMLASDIQFGDVRYIAITNSHWDQSIGVRLSGLPAGDYKLHDVMAGTSHQITSTTKITSIEPLGVRLYKVSQ